MTFDYRYIITLNYVGCFPWYWPVIEFLFYFSFYKQVYIRYGIFYVG